MAQDQLGGGSPGYRRPDTAHHWRERYVAGASRNPYLEAGGSQ